VPESFDCDSLPPRSRQIIRLSGYTAHEKVAIARKYLEPQTRESAGIPDGSTVVSDDAMRELITEYARWVP